MCKFDLWVQRMCCREIKGITLQELLFIIDFLLRVLTCMYACPPFVPGSGGVQKRASDPPKMELWAGVYLHVGAL